MNFDNCLAKGKEAELKVLHHIQKKHSSAYMMEWYCKWKDIYIPDIDISVEVKWDIVSDRTGNYLFEALCDGKLSGIATTESQWWALCDGDGIHYFSVENIFDTIVRNAIGITRYFWEYDNDKIEMGGYLVPKGLLRKENKVHKIAEYWGNRNKI